MKRVDEVMEIIRNVNMVGTYADQHKWDAILNECFDETVIADYSSMVGGDVPGAVEGSKIVDGWKAFLPGFDHTHHFITNHRIEFEGENEAMCFSSVNAWHYIKDEKLEEKDKVWTVFGTYEHHLMKRENGWRIDKMKLNFTFQTGNPKLPQLAQNRKK